MDSKKVTFFFLSLFYSYVKLHLIVTANHLPSNQGQQRGVLLSYRYTQKFNEIGKNNFPNKTNFGVYHFKFKNQSSSSRRSHDIRPVQKITKTKNPQLFSQGFFG